MTDVLLLDSENVRLRPIGTRLRASDTNDIRLLRLAGWVHFLRFSSRSRRIRLPQDAVATFPKISMLIPTK